MGPGNRRPGDASGRAFPGPLLVLFLLNILNFYDRQALGAIAEPLRREFHLADAQLGLLTTGFTLLYAIASAPLGRLADTRSRKRMLAIGTSAWAALTGLGGLASSFPMLLATRLGVGIGEAVCAPAAASWIGDVVPAERRARAMAWFMMAVPVGGMLSFAVTGPVAQSFGWRAALALAAAPAVALVPTLLWLKEPDRGLPRDAQLGEAGAFARQPSRLLRTPAFLWIVASGAAANFALYSFSTFLPAFLTRFHGLSIARAGLWTGIGAGVAGILGALAAGHFGDRVAAPRGRGRMSLAAAAALAAAPLAFAAIRLPAGRAALAIPLIMAAYGLLQTYYGLVYAAMQDIVPPALRGAAMGIYFAAMYLCGASFGPLVTGTLSDRLARAAAASGRMTEAARAMGLREAMYLIPAFAVVLAIVLQAGAKAMPGAHDAE